MASRKLVQQLDSLKAIKPRTEWSTRTREILLSQVASQGSGQEAHTSAVGSTTAYLRGAIIFGYRQTFEQLFARPLVLSGSLSVFVVMVVSAVLASQGSAPGDPLYAVKRTEESVRVAFVSPADRPGLQLDFANKRIQEFSDISSRSLSVEEKVVQKARLAEEATTSIGAAREDLLRLTKETPDTAVRVATALKERATQSVQQAKNAELSDVVDGLNEAKGSALEVIVDKQGAAKVSDTEVTGHLQEAIGELEERLASLESVSAAGFKDGTSFEGTSSEVKEVLRHARESLDRKDFKIALQGISRSRGLIAGAEKKLRQSGGDADTGDTAR